LMETTHLNKRQISCELFLQENQNERKNHDPC
jgi:hypothetical protein